LFRIISVLQLNACYAKGDRLDDKILTYTPYAAVLKFPWPLSWIKMLVFQSLIMIILQNDHEINYSFVRY